MNSPGNPVRFRIGTPRSLQGRLAAAVAALVTCRRLLDARWAAFVPHSTDQPSPFVPGSRFEWLLTVPSETRL